MKKLVVVTFILAAVIAGVIVFLPKECAHKYPDAYEVLREASCTEAGTQAKKCIRCGEYGLAEELEKLPHDTKRITIIEATCLSVGMEQEICSDCDTILGIHEVPLSGHVGGEDIIDKEVTCTENGEKHAVCIYCDEVLPTETIEATGHCTEGNVWKFTVEPTCIDKGFMELRCDFCDAIMDTEEPQEFEALGHKVEKWEYTVQGNCEVDAERHGVCTVCERDCFEIIVASGHNYTEWMAEPTDAWGKDCSVIAPTCTEEGVEYRFCSNCQTVESRTVSSLGHTDGEWITDVEATCSTTGKMSQSCTTCGAIVNTEIIPTKDHTPGEWKTDITPECEKVGEKHRDCKECGAKRIVIEVIPAKGHSGEWIVDRAATCLETGERHRNCPICKSTVTEVIKANGHSGEWTVDRDATCLETGEKHKDCIVCGATRFEVEVIPAKKHTPSDWKVITDATCAKAGLRKQFCTVCEGELKSETIPVLEHTKGDWTVTAAPTCHTVGKKELKCTKCSASLEIQILPAVDHHLEESTELAIKATCTTTGETVYKCTFEGCNIVRREVVEKTPHVVSESSVWTVVKPATCEQEGERTASCSECQAIAKTEVIPAAGHTLSETTQNATCEKDGAIIVRCTAEGCTYTETTVIPNLGGHDYTYTVEDKDTLRLTCAREGCGNTYTQSIPDISIAPPSLIRDETQVGTVSIIYMKEYLISAVGGYGELTYEIAHYCGDDLIEKIPYEADQAISVIYRIGNGEEDLHKLVIKVKDAHGNEAEITQPLASNA